MPFDNAPPTTTFKGRQGKLVAGRRGREVRGEKLVVRCLLFVVGSFLIAEDVEVAEGF